MSIIVKAGGKQFTPAPEGPQRAVCCDVIDLGIVKTSFGEKHQIKVLWQSEKLTQDGKPYMCQQTYNATLGSADKPSKLREHLECWRGWAFTEQEAESFDVERLKNANCYIQIQHVKMSKGGTWAAVKAIMPPLPGAKLVVRDYVRAEPKPAAAAPDEPGTHDGDPFPPATEEPLGPGPEDDIPF
jgi:hypothetical protein